MQWLKLPVWKVIDRMFEPYSGLPKKFFPTHSQGCPEKIDVAQIAIPKYINSKIARCTIKALNSQNKALNSKKCELRQLGHP